MLLRPGPDAHLSLSLSLSRTSDFAGLHPVRGQAALPGADVHVHRASALAVIRNAFLKFHNIMAETIPNRGKNGKYARSCCHLFLRFGVGRPMGMSCNTSHVLRGRHVRTAVT